MPGWSYDCFMFFGSVCLFVCVSTLIAYAIITSHALLPCQLYFGWLGSCCEYWCSYSE